MVKTNANIAIHAFETIILHGPIVKETELLPSNILQFNLEEGVLLYVEVKNKEKLKEIQEDSQVFKIEPINSKMAISIGGNVTHTSFMTTFKAGDLRKFDSVGVGVALVEDSNN